MNFDAQLLPLAISLLAAAWLGVCAWSDLRTRHVPNGLTLPAIPLAILAAWLTRESRGERLFEFAFHLVVMTLPLFVAWRSHLLGGAVRSPLNNIILFIIISIILRPSDNQYTHTTSFLPMNFMFCFVQ